MGKPQLTSVSQVNFFPLKGSRGVPLRIVAGTFSLPQTSLKLRAPLPPGVCTNCPPFHPMACFSPRLRQTEPMSFLHRNPRRKLPYSPLLWSGPSPDRAGFPLRIPLVTLFKQSSDYDRFSLRIRERSPWKAEVHRGTTLFCPSFPSIRAR